MTRRRGRRPWPSTVLRATAHVAVGRHGRIGSTIYGTIIVMAALTAAYAAERHDPGKLVELVVTAVFVFWAAFVYAYALSESIENESRLNRPDLERIAGRELGIILSAIVPISALLLGVVGLVNESTSIWLAIAAGLATLAVQGYRYARAASLGRIGTASILVVNLLFGLCVVAMKVTLIH